VVGGWARELGHPSKISKACPCHWLVEREAPSSMSVLFKSLIEDKLGYIPERDEESPAPAIDPILEDVPKYHTI
jgi:hypothetical protein